MKDKFFGRRKMRNHIALLVIAVMIVLVPVTHGQKEPEFRVVEENGIPIAQNSDHPVPLPDDPKDIIFSENFLIGEMEGVPNSIFGAFISFAVDERGCMYVLDWRGKTIGKFDETGKFLLSFGGPGQGPGEFSSPTEIRYLPDGHIVIFEAESQKYSCFTKKGEFARSGRFQKLMYPPYFGLTNGNIIAMNVLRDPDQTVFVMGIFDEKAELVKPLHRMERKPDPPWPGGNESDARARRYAQTFSRVAFRRESVLALNDREDLFFAYTDNYEIKIYNADGELKKIVRTELPFLPVANKDRQAFLDYHLPRDISTWSTMEKSLQNRIKSLIEFPDEKPAFLSLIPMDEGYLMVVRDGYYGRNALIDIFDPSGRFIIEKMVPFPIKNGTCKGNKLYTLHEDEDGNQFVKCYTYKLAQ
jgi:hypothetical protein